MLHFSGKAVEIRLVLDNREPVNMEVKLNKFSIHRYQPQKTLGI